MNARAEAVARLAGRYDARVLEPSPLTVTQGPWFADDPVGRDAPADPGLLSRPANGPHRRGRRRRHGPKLAGMSR